VQGFEGQLSDFLAHFISKKLIKASNFSNLSNIQEPLINPEFKIQYPELPFDLIALQIALKSILPSKTCF
jgi:hypothetical protein